jgi:hypothetical protein
MAVGFVVLVGSIAAGLSAMITSSAGNRVSLERIRDRQYAAEAGVESAIVEVRALDRTATPRCGSTSTLNNITVRVDCAQAVNVVASPSGQLFAQRNVVFVACEDTGSACAAGKVIVRASVNFEQRYSSAVTKTYIQSWSVSG